VKKTVLVALVAAAGLATSVNAQSPNPQFELRIVVDGTPGSPFQGGSNFFPAASASNPVPTMVGLTIQARVTTTGTTANWGIVRAGFVSGVGQSWITHNDALTNQTNSQWSANDVATSAFRRGVTGDAGTPTPRRGLFNNFRNAVTSNMNMESGNGTFVNTFNNGLMQRGSVVGGAWVAGTGPGTGGGIVGVDGNSPSFSNLAGLAPLVDSSITLPDGSQGLAPAGTGLGRAGATATDTVTSPWENIYRFMFVPRTNGSDPLREVTVSAGFRLDYANTIGDASGAGEGPFFKVGDLQNRVTSIIQGSVQFEVPTPGALALLGLGGLAVARRRRA
jgi:uncharacterized protein (TIGR03382 family)